ncbi:MAG: (d)CMP kinase, partial [Stellaceae bacterium]
MRPPGDSPAKPFVVAIDGPAASGKGTLAHRLAQRFGLAHLDTGKLYRVAADLVLIRGGDPADPATAELAAQEVAPTLTADPTLIFAPRLLGNDVTRASSVMATIPAVRTALLSFQRSFAMHPPPPSPGVAAKGAVLDGRDIGTAVCRDAAVKLFVTASPEARAKRRVKELRGRGAAAIYEDVLQDLMERDARDSDRWAAPLLVAPDAELIDTTTLDADAVLERAADITARAFKE